jgi:hypothetical protein
MWMRLKKTQKKSHADYAIVDAQFIDDVTRQRKEMFDSRALAFKLQF